MKIGIFDSGLGGLVILRSIVAHMPQYPYHYFGDTKNLPYGVKCQEEIYRLTLAGIDYLFKHNCALIIIACNTASAEALRRIQQQYLPIHYPERRVLGVIIPTIEEIRDSERVGLLATEATIASQTFNKELAKINPKIKLFEQAASQLVPFIEDNNKSKIKQLLPNFINPLLENNIQSLILGCTHFPFIRKEIKELCDPEVKVISQTEIIPAKLQEYLRHHNEIEKLLDHTSVIQCEVTMITKHIQSLAKAWFPESGALRLVSL